MNAILLEAITAIALLVIAIINIATALITKLFGGT